MIRTQITVGILLMLAAIGTLAFMFATEETRMAETELAIHGRRVENGAVLYHNNCERCHGERAVGIPGLCPHLNSVTLLQQRVEETGWAGSVHTFIVDAIRGGRLTSTRPDQYFGSTAEGMAMPFWSQDYGGPLRPDQISDLAYFIENFGEVEPIVEEPAEPIPPDADLVEVGLDLYRANGCQGCHELDAVGSPAGIGPTHNDMAAIAAQRIQDPNYTGNATTAEEYILESIVEPGIFVVEGYPNVMPSYASVPEDQLNAMVEMLMAQ
jgi:mono/diheme cytochrome c family protein